MRAALQALIRPPGFHLGRQTPGGIARQGAEGAGPLPARRQATASQRGAYPAPRKPWRSVPALPWLVPALCAAGDMYCRTVRGIRHRCHAPRPGPAIVRGSRPCSGFSMKVDSMPGIRFFFSGASFKALSCAAHPDASRRPSTIILVASAMLPRRSAAPAASCDRTRAISSDTE